MPTLPLFDLADYLPAAAASTADWPGAARDNGIHTTAYGLSASASRPRYAQRTDLLMNDSLERLHLSVWLNDAAQIDTGRHCVRAARHDVVALHLARAPMRMAFGGDNHHVVLTLAPALLHQLAAAQAEPFLARLRHAGGVHAQAGQARVLRAAHELQATLTDGTASALLREAKSLELLALVLQAAAPHPQQPAPPASRHQARLRQARELLLRDLANAPDIPTLARACGLNAFQLKQGFKALFGLSVHALYQHERMHQAWQLIESGQANASEAGALVGYSNASHFGAAFRKQFGLLPSELKRRTAVGLK